MGQRRKKKGGENDREKVLSLIGLLTVLGVGAQANAQLTTLIHVWSVPGAMQTSNGIGTYVACTNGGTATQEIGVEMYGSTGTFLGSSSLSVAASATIIFGSANAAGISVDGNLGTGNFKGHARVKASTSRGVLCSAFLADYSSPTPLFMTNLSVIKKFSQKGQ